MKRRRKKYRKLNLTDYQTVDTYVRQCVAQSPGISTTGMFKALKKSWQGEQKLTHGHIVAAWRRATGYVPKPKAPLTTTDSTGQQTWQWPSSKGTAATLGSLSVSYTTTESTFDQGIRLIKAGLLLIEGGKGA